MKPPVVGFAGMTHLGLVSASAVAACGFQTRCFDPDRGLIERLVQQDWPVLEPGLDELIRGNGARQTFTSARDDLSSCDVVYVAPDVPTDDHGRGDVSGLTALVRDVAGAMNPGAVLVILSQVPPGYTRAIGAWPRGRLYYQVETLVFVQAVEQAGPHHRRLGRAGSAALLALSRGARRIRMSDPADALRKRGAGEDIHQLLPRRVGKRRQYFGGVVRKNRRRLGGDRAGTKARSAHRRLRLSCPGSRHRGGQSRTRSCHRSASVRGLWNRSGADFRLAAQ